MLSLFAKQRIIAHSGYNRLLLLHAYIAIHACIGTMYAWSNFNVWLIS